jgi:hypothetical protein
MDEYPAGGDQEGRRRATSGLGRLSLAQPAQRIGPVRPRQFHVMDELVIHPRHTVRLVLRRRAMSLASRACHTVKMQWRREQQLLGPKHKLRWDAQTALLSSLGSVFTLGARLTAFLLRIEAKTSAGDREAGHAGGGRTGSGGR